MAVKMVPKFKQGDISKIVVLKKKAIKDAILLRLIRIGEQFVVNARTRANFKDDTANLRSSIGYVVLENGKQVSANFEQRKGGPDGVNEAEKVMSELKKKYPSGYVLLGVAGMDYAAAVESKGYDVITSSSGIAEASLKSAMVQLGNKLKARG